MKYYKFLLIILTLKTSLTVCQVSTPTHHLCKGTKTEQAGLSGSIEFSDKCDITLTNFTLLSKNETGQFSITGVSMHNSCRDTAKLTINNKQYCVNESVTDTLVELAGDEIRFVMNNAGPGTFTLSYYKVFVAAVNAYHVGLIYLEGVISSVSYPATPLYDEYGRNQIYIFLPQDIFLTFTLFSPNSLLTPGQVVFVFGAEPSGRKLEGRFTHEQVLPKSVKRDHGNLVVRVEAFLEHRIGDGPIYLLMFQAVKCDFKAIPTVADASYTLHQSAEHSVALPGYVNVTYKCNDDYELVNPVNNTVICSLNRQQTGDGSSELVTADWSDVKDIKCQIDANGKSKTVVIAVLVVVVVVEIVAAVIFITKTKMSASRESEKS